MKVYDEEQHSNKATIPIIYINSLSESRMIGQNEGPDPAGTIKLVNASGMYDVLKIVVILLAQAKNKSISCNDLKEHLDISMTSVSNNLNRLVKAKILVRKDKLIPNVGRIVSYELSDGGGTIDFIINNLYD